MSIQVQQPLKADNVLVGGLVVHERNAVYRASALIRCASGDVLLSAGAAAEYVFFPIDSVVALVRRMRDGSAADIALVGHEGLVGHHAFAPALKTVDEIVVRRGGSAYCMPVEAFGHQFERQGGFHSAVLRFTGMLFLQVGQNAVCSRFHGPEARVATWLLMLHDRGASEELELSAAALAQYLAIDGTTAERTLDRLVAADAIRRRRQSVSIVDTFALEIRACECYERLRQIYAADAAA